jgi:hypothetical protein
VVHAQQRYLFEKNVVFFGQEVDSLFHCFVALRLTRFTTVTYHRKQINVVAGFLEQLEVFTLLDL